MPYFNQLIQRYGLATQFYSDQHGSLSALMWFVAGAAVTTNEATTSCQHSQDNVVRELLKRGYSLRAYEEDLPYAGYEGLMGEPAIGGTIHCSILRMFAPQPGRT